MEIANNKIICNHTVTVIEKVEKKFDTKEIPIINGTIILDYRTSSSINKIELLDGRIGNRGSITCKNRVI